MNKVCVFLFLSLTLLNGCTSFFEDYRIQGDKVLRHTWNEGNGGRETDVVGADPKSFKTFEIGPYLFGKDSRSLYYKGSIVEGADPETFERLIPIVDSPSFKETWYFRDRVHVWNSLLNLVESADPTTFELINENFSKDRKDYFFWDTRIDGIDYASFQPGYFNDKTSRDKDHVFYKALLLVGADVDTFPRTSEGPKPARE